MPDIAKATLKLAVMNLKSCYRLAVYCDASSTAPPDAPRMKYAMFTTMASFVNASIRYAIISEIIMMVIDQRAPMMSMK
jgi:hypothetical protein